MEPLQQMNIAISDDLKKLVIARLNLIPNNVTISIGADGEFTRNKLIENVKKENTVGREIVHSQLEFIKALSTGKFLDEIILKSN